MQKEAEKSRDEESRLVWAEQAIADLGPEVDGWNEDGNGSGDNPDDPELGVSGQEVRDEAGFDRTVEGAWNGLELMLPTPDTLRDLVSRAGWDIQERVLGTKVPMVETPTSRVIEVQLWTAPGKDPLVIPRDPMLFALALPFLRNILGPIPLRGERVVLISQDGGTGHALFHLLAVRSGFKYLCPVRRGSGHTRFVYERRAPEVGISEQVTYSPEQIDASFRMFSVTAGQELQAMHDERIHHPRGIDYDFGLELQCGAQRLLGASKT